MSRIVHDTIAGEGAIAEAPQADDLELRARRLSAQFGSEDAEAILAESILRQFPGKIALVSSFGAESATLLHLVARVNPETPVIFLDTGKHFAQTLSYRKSLARTLGLTNVRDISPAAPDLEASDPSGDLWRSNPDACCTIRKVRPLTNSLSEFDAWITGRKQFHGGGRAALPVFEAAAPHIKVNPIVRWSKDDLDAYAKTHDLPAHPLVAQGYPSIGCWPCTHPASDDNDPRAGRWRGAAKTECGIHTLAATGSPRG
ncbi:MAG: phosphoadenylyl-sulfate reductase [Pseudomonadota bacterium]